MAVPPEDVTQLLQSWGNGHREALDRLVPLVYAELHRLARGYMLGEREGHILQATALINEAFLRLINWKNVSWQNRAHFFGVSAQLMRRILVDFARSRNAKGGGAVSRVTLNETLIPAVVENRCGGGGRCPEEFGGLGPEEREDCGAALFWRAQSKGNRRVSQDLHAAPWSENGVSPRPGCCENSGRAALRRRLVHGKRRKTRGRPMVNDSGGILKWGGFCP